MSDEDIIQAAADVYIDLGGGGGRWVGREIAAAVVAAVRPLIEAQALAPVLALADQWEQIPLPTAKDVAWGIREAVEVGGQHTDTPPAMRLGHYEGCEWFQFGDCTCADVLGAGTPPAICLCPRREPLGALTEVDETCPVHGGWAGTPEATDDN